MGYENIMVEKVEHIGVIALNRPESLNTFNTQMAQELNSALGDLDQDMETRVVVLRGRGKGFCAGIDINELQRKDSLEYYSWIQIMEKPFTTIQNMKKPVIASVQDFALATGIGLVAAADLAMAAEGARFGATAVNVGLFCMGPAVSLSRDLGRKKALELLLTGDIIDAREAERIGLINKVVPGEQLAEETMKLAGKLAAKSPLALQLGKGSFYKMSDLGYEGATELANTHFAMLCATEDAHEGLEAFLNKRTPVWKLK